MVEKHRQWRFFAWSPFMVKMVDKNKNVANCPANAQSQSSSSKAKHLFFSHVQPGRRVDPGHLSRSAKRCHMDANAARLTVESSV